MGAADDVPDPALLHSRPDTYAETVGKGGVDRHVVGDETSRSRLLLHLAIMASTSFARRRRRRRGLVGDDESGRQMVATLWRPAGACRPRARAGRRRGFRAGGAAARDAPRRCRGFPASSPRYGERRSRRRFPHAAHRVQDVHRALHDGAEMLQRTAESAPGSTEDVMVEEGEEGRAAKDVERRPVGAGDVLMKRVLPELDSRRGRRSRFMTSSVMPSTARTSRMMPEYRIGSRRGGPGNVSTGPPGAWPGLPFCRLPRPADQAAARSISRSSRRRAGRGVEGERDDGGRKENTTRPGDQALCCWPRNHGAVGRRVDVGEAQDGVRHSGPFDKLMLLSVVENRSQLVGQMLLDLDFPVA